MELLNIGFWNILLDLAALTLCGITVFYIVGKKRSLATRRIQYANDERIRSIVEKTFDQFIRLDPGRSFSGMIDRVTKDQALRRARGVDTVSTGRRVKTRTGTPKKIEPNRLAAYDGVNAIRAGTGDNKSMSIYQFTTSGMSVKKISEKLAMPRCEVELIAKFQQRENKQAAVL